MKHNTMKWIWAVLIGFASTSLISSESWTRFRGENGQGRSQSESIPSEWNESDYRWKVELPGGGHSSPVIWKERIFLTGTDEATGKSNTFCLDVKDGRTLWKKSVSFRSHGKHKFNSFATVTGVVDERHFYVAWPTPTENRIYAFDHDGNIVWQKSMEAFKCNHAGYTSLMLHDNKLILPYDHAGESFIAALNSGNGEIVWKSPRRQAKAAYSTPCVYSPKGSKPQLIFNSMAHGITGVDPSTGKTLWELDGVFDKRSVSSPVIAGDLIIGSCGSGGGGNYVEAIRPGDPGSGEAPKKEYQIRRSAPYVPTSVAREGYLYLWSDSGIISCVKAESGQVIWNERVGGRYFGSPICIQNRLYCMSDTGQVVVVAAEPEFKLLARNDLDEMTHATPAAVGGRLYLRTFKHLISLSGKQERIP